MSRPIEPQKKRELLERCLTATIEVGTLDSSINALAKRIGTSGRMLVYHFGSKQELESQLISLLEQRLREQLWSACQKASSVGGETLTAALLEMWQRLVSPKMNGLVRLSMALSQQAMKGDTEAQAFLERESQQWIAFLVELTDDDESAIALLHLFQGAILDFLTTGNAARGQQTIKKFSHTLQPQILAK